METKRLDKVNLLMAGDMDQERGLFSFGHAGWLGIYADRLSVRMKRVRTSAVHLAPAQVKTLADFIDDNAAEPSRLREQVGEAKAIIATYVAMFADDHQHIMKGERGGDCMHCRARAFLGLP